MTTSAGDHGHGLPPLILVKQSDEVFNVAV